jgi:hypothetical protein
LRIFFGQEHQSEYTSSISGSIKPSGPGDGILRYRFRTPHAL